MRHLTVAAAMVALGAAPALAQTARRPPAPHPLPMLRERRIEIRRLDSAAANRATLGMSLAPTGSVRDTIGVFVTRVVPGGPAERAGIIEGDRIAAINDRDLRLALSDTGDAYAAGLPVHRFLYTVGKLTPGTTVRLRVWRNGQYRVVNVATARMADVYRHGQGAFFGGFPDGLLPQLEMLGPAIAGSVEGAMRAIPPDLDVRVERAMRDVPRTVRITVERGPGATPPAATPAAATPAAATPPAAIPRTPRPANP